MSENDAMGILTAFTRAAGDMMAATDKMGAAIASAFPSNDDNEPLCGAVAVTTPRAARFLKAVVDFMQDEKAEEDDLGRAIVDYLVDEDEDQDEVA